MLKYKEQFYRLASKDLDNMFKDAVEQLTHKKVKSIKVTAFPGRYSMDVQYTDGKKTSFTYDGKIPEGGVPYTKDLLED